MYHSVSISLLKGAVSKQNIQKITCIRLDFGKENSLCHEHVVGWRVRRRAVYEKGFYPEQTELLTQETKIDDKTMLYCYRLNHTHTANVGVANAYLSSCFAFFIKLWGR